MNESPIAPDMIRCLEQISDSDIAKLSLRTGGLNSLAISTESVVLCRYDGTKKLPPGPPVGLKRNSDGTYHIEHVAVVRVPQEDHLFQTNSILKHAKTMSLVIGIGCAVLTTGAAKMLFRPSNPAGISLPAAPCYVLKVARDGLVCKQSTTEIFIKEGSNFPDGRFRLGEISPGLDGFTATQTSGQRSFLFQFIPKDHL